MSQSMRNAFNKISFALIALALTLSAAAGVRFHAAPLNPEFIQWMRGRNPEADSLVRPDAAKSSANGLKVGTSVFRVAAPALPVATDGMRPRPLGYVPGRIDFGYLRNCTGTVRPLLQSKGGFATATLDSSFDLRTAGRVPSKIRDQGNYGTCWAHATLGSVESLLLTSRKGEFDFSEKHLANTHGRDNGFSEGGNGDMGISYLARLSGPIDEREDPYPDSSYYNSWARKYNENNEYLRELKVSKSPAGTPLMQALNVVQLTPLDAGKVDTARLNAIKEAVRDYGAVYVSYNHVWGALSADTKNFYWNGNENVVDYRGSGGHAVLIVGWDDNYSSGNFKYTPPGNGAFLVRNSWGSDIGDGGYLYYSYYDETFARGELFSWRTAVPVGEGYAGVYEHDPLGRVTQIGAGSETLSGANMFVARKDETLAAVGLYANAPGTSYSIDIYTGCSVSKPTSGTHRGTTTSGTLDCGYFTVPLNVAVPVSEGERFSVVVKLTTPGCTSPLAVEYYDWYVDYVTDPKGVRYTYIGYNGVGDFYSDPNGLYYCHPYDENLFLFVDTSSSRWTYYYTDYKWSDLSQHRYDCTSGATANPGESFASVDGGASWDDLTVAFDPTANFCCKVYTVPTAPAQDPVPSLAPTNLSAIYDPEAGKVVLSWGYDDETAEFRIYRGVTSTRPNEPIRTVSGLRTFEDTTVVKGQTYLYWVTAKKSGSEWLESIFGSTIKVTIPDDGPVARADLKFGVMPDWQTDVFLTSRYGSRNPQFTFVEGTEIFLNALVENRGDAVVDKPFAVRFSILDGGGALRNRDVVLPGLPEGSYLWQDMRWSDFDDLEPGWYELRITLDAENEIDDADRTNNSQTVPFFIESRIPLAQALDCPSLIVETNDKANRWYGDAVSDDGVVGGSAARSAKVPAGQESWMKVTVSGRGCLSFRFVQKRATMLDDFDLWYTVDGGDPQYLLALEWSERTIALTEEGEHVIEWTCVAGDPDSYALVDNVRWSTDCAPAKPEIAVDWPVQEVEETGRASSFELVYLLHPDIALDTTLEWYRSDTPTGEKTLVADAEVVQTMRELGEVRISSGEPGRVYCYWLKVTTPFGETWSDPVRAGVGLAIMEKTITVPTEGCVTNFICGAGSFESMKFVTSVVTSADAWIHVTDGGEGFRGEPCTIVFDANTAGQERRGTIHVRETFDGGGNAERAFDRSGDIEVVQSWSSAEEVDFVIIDGVLTNYTGTGGDVVIPSGVTNIAERVFYKNKSLVSVVVPDSVVTIGRDCFYQCTGLQSVILGRGLKALGTAAFSGCTGLTDVVLPENLIELGERAFYNCYQIKTVAFNDGLTTIGNRAFESCSAIQKLTLPDSLQLVGTKIFASCTGVCEVVFGSRLQTVSDDMFNGCLSLKILSLTNGIAQIGSGAFDGCSALSEIVLGKEMEQIGYYSFANCTSLTNVTYCGNAPMCHNTIYHGASADLVSHVPFGSTGWDGTPGSEGLPESGLFPANGGTDARPIVMGTESEIAPEAPTGLEAVGTTNGVTLTWVAGKRAMSYRIYRETDGEDEACIAEVPHTDLTYLDETCRAGVAYRYRVASWNLGGEVAGGFVEAHRLVTASFTQNAVELTSEGGKVQIGVDANADWTAETKDDWLGMSFAAEGGNGTITLDVGKCREGRAGSVKVSVGAETCDQKDYEISVTQAAALDKDDPNNKVKTPVITCADGSTFSGEKTTVTITCETEGADIFFRIDGLTPRPVSTYRYGGPFEIYNTAEIVAFAVKDGMEQSDFAELTVTWVAPVEASLAYALDIPDETVTSDGGDLDWRSVVDATAVGGYSARSGAIGQNATNRMSWTVSGAGTVTFQWRADCESDPRDRYSYDNGTFAVDGMTVSQIDGCSNGWRKVTAKVSGGGEHVLTWSYAKDVMDAKSFGGEDCIWVDHVVWTPADKNMPTDEWWEGHRDLLTALGKTWEMRDEAAKMDSPGPDGTGKAKADGTKWKVWEEYVAGTEPLSEKRFAVTSFTYEDGTIDVTWDPDLKDERTYTILGAETPGAAADGWTPVSKTPDAKYRFFKVKVEMK